jgi:CrcB protein
VSLAVVLGVGLLGGLGAVARFLVDHAITTRRRTAFPLGTLAVNLTGAVALGVLAGAALSSDAYRLWGVGLLGGYTTFSTWMLETQRLNARLAVLNVVASLVFGVLGVWLGRGLG